MEGNTLAHKRCSSCGEHKPVTEFYNRFNICKPCHKDRQDEWNRQNPYKSIFLCKKSGAKRGSIEFTLTFDNVVWNTHCPVLGLELDYTRRRKSRDTRPNSPSFDRVNPNLGYVPGNVIIVSHLANTIKSNATVDQLERVAAFYRQLIPHEGVPNAANDNRMVHQAVA